MAVPSPDHLGSVAAAGSCVTLSTSPPAAGTVKTSLQPG